MTPPDDQSLPMGFIVTRVLFFASMVAWHVALAWDMADKHLSVSAIIMAQVGVLVLDALAFGVFAMFGWLG